MRKPPPEVSSISAPLEGLRLQIKRTEAELIARQSNDEGNGDEMAVLFTGNWRQHTPSINSGCLHDGVGAAVVDGYTLHHWRCVKAGLCTQTVRASAFSRLQQHDHYNF